MTTAAQTTLRHRTRAVLAAALLGSALLGGCAVFSPVQTDYAYQAADGVNATFGDLDVRGLVVVADEKDGPGSIVGQLANTSDEDIEVAFGVQGEASEPITVPRYGAVALGEGETVEMATVPASPGDLVQLQIVTRATGQNVLEVPVLPALEYYEQHRSSATPSPSGTASPTPNASESSSS